MRGAFPLERMEKAVFRKFFGKFGRQSSAIEHDDGYLTDAPKLADQAPPLDWNEFDSVLRDAAAGDADAQNEAGRFYLANGEAEQAEKWFRQAAAQGLPKAKHNLGVMAHMNGDVAGAVNWFKEAHADGWSNSSVALAMLIREAGEEDFAIKLLLPSAQRGVAAAQDALGQIYFDRSTDREDALSRNWSLAAAKQGVPSSIRRLGLLFHEGRVSKRDPVRAAAHFLRAAQLGDPAAQALIGVAYHLGAGVEQDNIEAAHWIMRGADQGNELCLSYLHAQRGIASLSSEELEEGRRRADLPIK